MFLIGLGKAVPPFRYLQSDCWDALRQSTAWDRLAPRSRAILRKVLLGDNGILSRHLALDELRDAFDMTPDALHGRFAREAPALAAEAGAQALQDAGMEPGAIDALLISTCTGYLCPGLTSYVAERLGLRPEVLLLDLVGQGCGAALPNLRAGEALVASGRAGRVLSISVEVCSAAFYLDDDPGVLISACLFGDGAAAAILSSEPSPGGRRVEWVTAGSLLSPEDRDYLRFEQRGGMLRNILARQVPAIAAKHAERVLQEVSRRAGVEPGSITGWMLHAGGRDVLLAMRERLGLVDADLRWSAGILSEYGNLSSPFVLFVLESALRGGAGGGHWWLSSFGAGFSCHGALLRVT